MVDETGVDDDGSIEIEIEVPEGSDNAEVSAKKENQTDEKPSGKEKDLEEHSESVKKRIDKLTYRIREAERREQAALDFARGLKNELDNTKIHTKILDKTLVSEFDNRLRTEEKMAKDKLRQAIDSGDVDSQIDAQSQLSNLAVETERLRMSKLRREQEEANRAQAAIAQQEEQERRVTHVPRPDQKAQSWAERNEWFGNDRAMTATAYAIHADLVETEGYDPTSDDYYNELDSRIHSEFPHKFRKAGDSKRPTVAVASARSTVRSDNKQSIKLTASQIAIAKRLGVSLQEYARHAQKQMQG
jgi:hypothetical protein